MSDRPISVPTRNHPFPLELSSTALLIVDMQNDFCHPESVSAELGLDVSLLRRIIPTLQAVLSWARQQGLLVIFTKESHTPDLSDLAPSKKVRYENSGSPVGLMGTRGRYLVQGEWGSEVIEELKPLASEIELAKPAQSVFVNSQVESVLQQHGITHLLITGVTTECCVLASYRHASDLGYFCLLLDDCCAAFDPLEHVAAIDVVLSENGVVGWVATSSQLMQAFNSVANHSVA